MTRHDLQVLGASAGVIVVLFAAGQVAADHSAVGQELPPPDEPTTEARLRHQLATERERAAERQAAVLAQLRRSRVEARGLRRAVRDKRYGPEHAVRVAAHLSGVPASVIRRCIQGESRWNPNAENPKVIQGQQARGLLQILSPNRSGIRSTWTGQTSFGAAGWSPYDIYANVIGGAQIMAADQQRGKGWTWAWVAC